MIIRSSRLLFVGCKTVPKNEPPIHTPTSCHYSSAHNKPLNYNYPIPVLDEAYLCDPSNKHEIINNIKRRKGIGDINKVLQLHSENSIQTKEMLIKEMLMIPNKTHPDIISYGEDPRVVKVMGTKRNFNFKPAEFYSLSKTLNLFRSDLSNFTGHRSYFFNSLLAEFEATLVKYSLKRLRAKGFEIISVPDIVQRSVIESCGMETQGSRSQVYSLDKKNHGIGHCLSGTAEMALAGYLMNKKIHSEKLPLRLAAVSRCFRAETSRTSEERGIYRVHQFTKVEMFGVSAPEDSSSLLEEFRVFQEHHFESLGFHLRTLDMPPHELGAQAYRKYDMEAWLPGRNIWAELSSCSDCTDYQSRRLAIRSDGRFVHTVNGTAAAIPRLLITLFESHQELDGSVRVPPALQPFFKNIQVINKENTKHVPQLKPIKRVRQS